MQANSSAGPLTTAALQLAAPAKLNLSLRVVTLRGDGYHELESLIALVELADDLRLAPGPSRLLVHLDPDMRADGAAVPTSASSNLAWRGLRTGLGPGGGGASLELTKRVPVMAGLGGGSSDAAAGWRLGRRWTGAAEQASAGDLGQLARIGADVPFFAAQVGTAWVTGIGERVEVAVVPPGTPADVVLVSPSFALATGAVFAELRRSDWTGRGPGPRETWRPDAAHNDLLAAARRLRPELDEVIRRTRAAGLEPNLSGSGPTFFAFVDDRERADDAVRRLRQDGLAALRTRLRPEPASIEVGSASTEEQR